LLRDQFQDALRFANTVLHLEATDYLRAHCLHWIAIAMASLGYPSEAVESVFQNAIQLAPDEEQFCTNLELFKNGVSRVSGVPLQWEKTPPNRIQQFALQTSKPVCAAN
jgi:hypothetical protein